MQKIVLSILIIGLIAGGCHTTKQTQKVVKDSNVSSSPATKLKPVDSTEILKQALSDKINAAIDFTTFYAKAKADFDSPQASGSATVYIKMRKDSVIWVSVTGPLNIEGARVLITKDSVKVMNKLDHTIHISSINNLQKITKLPFTFNDFQNAILGRAVILDNAIYNVGKDSVSVSASNDVLKYVYAFTKNNLLLGQSNYQTQNSSGVTTANVFYNGYQKINNIDFATSRDVAVTGANSAKLDLNFKEYNFNQPQDYVFTISKNYTIKYE